MLVKNTQSNWGIPSRILHWTAAVVILFLLGLGFYMTRVISDPLEQFDLFQLHKSWGFVAFSLVMTRLIWRIFQPVMPLMPEGTPQSLIRASRLGHYGLYLFMFLMPVSGWLMSTASPLQDTFGIKNKVFNSFELYDPFVPGSEALATFFSWIHTLSSGALVTLIIGHIGAALWHHFFHRDQILTRIFKTQPEK